MFLDMCSKISASFKGNFLKGTVFVILEKWYVLLDSFIPIFGTHNRLIKKVNSDWKKKISQILITLEILLNHYKWCVVYVWCYYFIVTVCCYWYLYLLGIHWNKKYLMSKCQKICLVVTVRGHSSLFQKESCCGWVLGEESWRNQV